MFNHLDTTIMKELKAKLYLFSELSEDAQQKVIDRERYDWQEMHNDAWARDYEDSLKAFCDLVGIECRNWEVDSYNYDYRFSFKHDIFDSWGYGMDAKNVTGKYLARFMRDICFDVYKGKYFGTLIPHAKDAEHPNGTEHIKRYSKVLFDSYDCPFTGFCGDNFILHPIYEWFEHPDYNKSLHDLVDECLDSFFKSWRDDIESGGSDEYVREEILANEQGEMYFEDGTLCRNIPLMREIA